MNVAAIRSCRVKLHVIDSGWRAVLALWGCNIGGRAIQGNTNDGILVRAAHLDKWSPDF